MSEEDKAEQLCWICIHKKMLIGKEVRTLGDDLFPIDPYCEKGHGELNFYCKDFEPSIELLREMISDMIDSGNLQKDLDLLSCKLPGW